jgi:hypothetical protein
MTLRISGLRGFYFSDQDIERRPRRTFAENADQPLPSSTAMEKSGPTFG